MADTVEEVEIGWCGMVIYLVFSWLCYILNKAVILCVICRFRRSTEEGSKRDRRREKGN